MSFDKTFAFTNECPYDKKVIYSILMNERSPYRRLGYEHIISFNNTLDAKKVKSNSELKKYFLNSMTMDCNNTDNCIRITSYLLKNGIKNLDLGAFQINTKSHSLPLTTYFDYQKSYMFTCDYLKKNVDLYGFNWFAVASHHSRTPEYNEDYQEKLKANYQILLKLDNL